MLAQVTRKFITGLVALTVGALAVAAPGGATAAPRGSGPVESPAASGGRASPTRQGRALPDGNGTQGNPIYLLNRDNRAEKFWRGSLDCQLWHSWEHYPYGPWSLAYSLGGCLLDDGISGEANLDGRLEILGHGTDMAIWHIAQAQTNGVGGWRRWASLGGAFQLAWGWTETTWDGRILVYALGTDGRFWWNVQWTLGCCWSGWYPY